MRKIKPGLYKHYKGRDYVVIGTARHSETLEELIVYQALYRSRFGKNTLWVRPKKMFLEKLRVDGHLVPRFRYITKTTSTA